jgi:hypothetical protein
VVVLTGVLDWFHVDADADADADASRLPVRSSSTVRTVQCCIVVPHGPDIHAEVYNPYRSIFVFPHKNDDLKLC